ncbi:MAG TPA: hypothetical protein VIY48_05765 [Candidatus Paceibacterota bacterium]
MGKHGKTENLNDKPFNENASPEVKAREFDQQYGQNRTYTVTPAIDAAKKKD